MTIKETALIKGPGHYHFRVYTGYDLSLKFRGDKYVTLKLGDVIGVRKSSSGKDVRLVLPKNGPNYLNFVFSVPTSQQEVMSRFVRFLTKKERDAYSLQLVGGRFD